MHSYRAGAILALFAIASLAACAGSNSGAEGSSSVVPSLSVNGAPKSGLDSNNRLCAGREGGVPGTYLSLYAPGDVKGSEFHAATQPGTSYWLLQKYTKQPQPTPSASPIGKPSPVWGVFYLYSGTFKMKNGQVGCMSLFTGMHGQPILGRPYSGFASGFPQLKQAYGGTLLVATGPVEALEIDDLSAKGGHGTVTLKMSGGTSYVNGAITLTQRSIIAADAAP